MNRHTANALEMFAALQSAHDVLFTGDRGGLYSQASAASHIVHIHKLDLRADQAGALRSALHTVSHLQCCKLVLLTAVCVCGQTTLGSGCAVLFIHM